jgi:ribosomal 50S subunit-recycling heat shock protein
MRLDRFLKASGICPRRTVAQQLCDAGDVSVNGKRAKSAHEVRVADQIVVRRRDKVSTLRVLAIPQRTQMSKQAGRDLYELTDEQIVSDLV